MFDTCRAKATLLYAQPLHLLVLFTLRLSHPLSRSHASFPFAVRLRVLRLPRPARDEAKPNFAAVWLARGCTNRSAVDERVPLLKYNDRLRPLKPLLVRLYVFKATTSRWCAHYYSPPLPGASLLMYRYALLTWGARPLRYTAKVLPCKSRPARFTTNTSRHPSFSKQPCLDSVYGTFIPHYVTWRHCKSLPQTNSLDKDEIRQFKGCHKSKCFFFPFLAAFRADIT